MRIRLRLGQNVHLLFVHVTTIGRKWAWSLKNEFQEHRMVLDSLTVGLLNAHRHVSQPYLHRSEVVQFLSYTETGEEPGELRA